jgi:hypothetical protein
MGGTSKSSTDTQQTATTNPWAPTIGALNGIIGQVGNQLGNTNATPAESNAFSQLIASGQAGNPYAPGIANTTNTLLSGGGPDRTGIASDAYTTLQKQLMPWANGSLADPSQNPALRSMLDTIMSDTTNSVNGQFAAAGRDLSGMNMQTLARGIAQGEAPTLLNAQQTALGAAQNLYNAGNTTAGILSGLDQTRLGNMTAGAQLAPSALDAANWGPSQVLAATQAQRQLPVQSLQALTGILGPIAGLGGTTSSTGHSDTTQQMSGAQQFALLGSGFGNLAKLFGG